MTLEELPPVLVLHLKRFVFEKTGGCQKLSKNIDYPVDLEISKGMDPEPTTPQDLYTINNTFLLYYNDGTSCYSGKPMIPMNSLILAVERQQFFHMHQLISAF